MHAGDERRLVALFTLSIALLALAFFAVAGHGLMEQLRQLVEVLP